MNFECANTDCGLRGQSSWPSPGDKPFLRTFGRLRLEVGLDTVDLDELVDGKTGEVLHYLLTHDRAPSTKLTIASEVWGLSLPSHPAAAVENAVSRIRRCIDPLISPLSGETETASVILTTCGGYRWNEDVLLHDLRVLSGAFACDRRGRKHILEHHADVFTGCDARHFAAGLSGHRWVDDYRNWLSIRLQRFHLELTKHLLDTGNVEDSCWHAELAYERYSWSDDALLLVMLAYCAMGERSAALQTYKHHCAADDVDTAVRPDLVDLANGICAGEAVSELTARALGHQSTPLQMALL